MFGRERRRIERRQGRFLVRMDRAERELDPRSCWASCGSCWR